MSMCADAISPVCSLSACTWLEPGLHFGAKTGPCTAHRSYDSRQLICGIFLARTCQIREWSCWSASVSTLVPNNKSTHAHIVVNMGLAR
jgi:hypothetical protein